ncbi:hypothetical protein [Sphaerisporangium sp. TRM90804]|uniref:hypothetical protein n=1 Tax=Sphaerisporangium sp. TRM90804 TaxID=3031113 RepID=UPI00244897FA|nr:hypothetical protein [Sphaerisporangium sp. TRM90804]MDH2428419.1 hypothetical protein [Sphaerisporangium sp. TRM90804]
MDERVWILRSGEEVVGAIHVNDGEFPWLSGRFIRRPAFARFEQLFADELVLVKTAGDDALQAWASVYDRINAALDLLTPDGERVAEFLLHIDGERAWFRWNDVPLEEQ